MVVHVFFDDLKMHRAHVTHRENNTPSQKVIDVEMLKMSWCMVSCEMNILLWEQKAHISLLVKLLHRCILCKWLKSFACACFIRMALLRLEDGYQNLYLLIKAKIGPAELIAYYFFFAVSFVILRVIFVSVLFSLGQLRWKNEIIWARCARRSILAICKTIIIGGIILARSNVVFESFFIPNAIDYVTSSGWKLIFEWDMERQLPE
jgi:hypothetical protein